MVDDGRVIWLGLALLLFLLCGAPNVLVVRDREGPPPDLPDTPLSHLPPRKLASRVREPIERDCSEGASLSAPKRPEMSGVHDFPVDIVG